MKLPRLIRFAYLAYFSQPVADRQLFRVLRKSPVASIVEIGLPDVQRTLRLIEVLSLYQDRPKLRYAGIDLFEAGTGATLPLKRAHQLLHPQVAHLRLLPGDPLGALNRYANSLTGTDLLIVHLTDNPASLDQAWYYIPRMLHEKSMVFLEEPAVNNRPAAFRQVPASEIAERAAASRRGTRRAA